MCGSPHPFHRGRGAQMLSARFVDALAFAIHAPGDQLQKGGRGVPYVAHLLGAASPVLVAGGNEDMAIASLLHDTIEDPPTTAGEIEAAPAPRVRLSAEVHRAR